MPVSISPQYSLSQCYRPDQSFATNYQGLPGTTPIAIPGTRDPRAGSGTNGYDPNLLAGIPVSIGARALVQIPAIELAGIPVPYEYEFVWRARSAAAAVRDAAGNRLSWSVQGSEYGTPDTTQVTVEQQRRWPMPASTSVVAYEQTEPVSVASPALAKVYQERLVVVSAMQVFGGRPLLPDGTPAVIQQGVYNPAVSPGRAWQATQVPLFMDCKGDELIILVRKAEILGGVPNPWDFGTVDVAFLETYGSAPVNYPDLGIYVSVGSNP